MLLPSKGTHNDDRSQGPSDRPSHRLRSAPSHCGEGADHHSPTPPDHDQRYASDDPPSALNRPRDRPPLQGAGADIQIIF